MAFPSPLLRGTDENDSQTDPSVPSLAQHTPAPNSLVLSSYSGHPFAHRALNAIEDCDRNPKLLTYPCNNTKFHNYNEEGYFPATFPSLASLALCIIISMVALAGYGLSCFISNVEEKVRSNCPPPVPLWCVYVCMCVCLSTALDSAGVKELVHVNPDD